MSSRGHRSVSLPDRDNVGLSPHWHGLSVMLWALNGLVYIVPLFAAGRWEHLIPTSWDIFPKACDTFKVYISLSAPGVEHFTPGDAPPAARLFRYHFQRLTLHESNQASYAASHPRALSMVRQDTGRAPGRAVAALYWPGLDVRIHPGSRGVSFLRAPPIQPGILYPGCTQPARKS
ncbi:hypothetical protein [Corynebacterium macginleyi]|uniref:hypothetical protein n=1 Tax=Corynebacterium macginleyi TaxID=38290 RepID=UPI001F1F5657|nr:hypothetical protein [Corynebacterium macginleyi]